MQRPKYIFFHTFPGVLKSVEVSVILVILREFLLLDVEIERKG